MDMPPVINQHKDIVSSPSQNLKKSGREMKTDEDFPEDPTVAVKLQNAPSVFSLPLTNRFEHLVPKNQKPQPKKNQNLKNTKKNQKTPKNLKTETNQKGWHYATHSTSKLRLFTKKELISGKDRETKQGLMWIYRKFGLNIFPAVISEELDDLALLATIIDQSSKTQFMEPHDSDVATMPSMTLPPMAPLEVQAMVSSKETIAPLKQQQHMKSSKEPLTVPSTSPMNLVKELHIKLDKIDASLKRSGYIVKPKGSQLASLIETTTMQPPKPTETAMSLLKMINNKLDKFEAAVQRCSRLTKRQGQDQRQTSLHPPPKIQRQTSLHPPPKMESVETNQPTTTLKVSTTCTCNYSNTVLWTCTCGLPVSAPKIYTINVTDQQVGVCDDCTKERVHECSEDFSSSDWIKEWLLECPPTVMQGVRMRGGATDASEVPEMVAQAIRSAYRHEIQLIHGRPNPARGDCVIEATTYNIGDRKEFTDDQKIDLDPKEARQLWVTELQTAIKSHYPDYIPDNIPNFNAEELWNKLKQDGVYEIDLMGDLMINGISRGSKKYLLIFNTSPQAADPIYVVEPEKFGGIRDTDIPVVLAYTMNLCTLYLQKMLK